MNLVDDLFDPGTLRFGNPSAVNRNREFLPLDVTAFDRCGFFAQLFFCIVQKWEKTFDLVGFFAKSTWRRNVKTVAAGVGEIRQADPFSDVGEISSADNRDGAVLCETGDGPSGLLIDHRFFVIVNNRT